MFRHSIAIFFTVLLLALTAAPTVISVLDDSADVSMFFSMSEEEEKGTKSLKDIKLLFTLEDTDYRLSQLTVENLFGYCFKQYTTPHLNIISPPPEQNIV